MQASFCRVLSPVSQVPTVAILSAGLPSAMVLLAGLVGRLLAFGTLVAPVFSLQFSYTSVQQCAPLQLLFSGLTTPVSGTPSSLKIIPFNATTIVVPLHDPDFSNGIAFSPLSFAAGSQFILSLDDASGNSIINVSEILPVLPSPSHNSTCIPGPGELPRRFFTMASPIVYQCHDFTINYNTTANSHAPSVRLYNPNGPSFSLNTTADDAVMGVATYTMAFPFGQGIILAIDNGQGTTETTPLMLVGGDSSSPKTCLPADFADIALDNSITHTTSANTYRIVAICAVVVGTIAVLLGIGLATFALRYHRRCRCQNTQVDGITCSEIDSHTKKSSGVIVLDDPFPTQVDNNSVDTIAFSPEGGYYDMNSLLSWSSAIHEDQGHFPWFEEKQSPNTADRLSDSVVFSSPIIPPVALLQPPLIGRSLSKRHLRAPSDVPADLNSRVWSTVSSDSFYPSPVSQTAQSYVGSIKGRSVGLPTSPRSGLGASISRESSKRTHTSEEWYGNVG